MVAVFDLIFSTNFKRQPLRSQDDEMLKKGNRPIILIYNSIYTNGCDDYMFFNESLSYFRLVRWRVT